MKITPGDIIILNICQKLWSNNDSSWDMAHENGWKDEWTDGKKHIEVGDPPKKPTYIAQL